MIVNALLRVIQRAQLKLAGHKQVKLHVDGKWYTVTDAIDAVDNFVLTVTKD